MERVIVASFFAISLVLFGGCAFTAQSTQKTGTEIGPENKGGGNSVQTSVKVLPAE